MSESEILTFGAEDVKGEDDIQGASKPLPGRYHVLIKDAAHKEVNGKPKVIMDFEVLAGTTPGQEGRTLTEFFAVTPKTVDMLRRLALVTGQLKPGEPPKAIDFSRDIGKQLVVEVVPNKYENREGQVVETVRVDYMGFWSLGNPAVNDVPRDKDAIKDGVQGRMQKGTSGDDGFGDPGQAPGGSEGSAGGDESWDDI